MPHPTFEDAQALALAHPSTFEAPSPEVLAGLQVGHFVKVCVGRERFWVKLTALDGDRLTGHVDNDLVRTDQHGLRCGDVVQFERRHVYATVD